MKIALVVAALTMAGSSQPTFTNPTDVKWGDAPSDLPTGAKISVMHGDPGKVGPYTLRLKLPSGYKIPAHWHTEDEQITVISGLFVLHMGDTMDAPAHDLSPGAFHFLPAKMHHAAEVRGETVVQVSGNGPFDIHYLDQSYRPKSATK